MKKIVFLILLTSCSFEAERNNLNIEYLNISNLSIGKYSFSLDDKNKK